MPRYDSSDGSVLYYEDIPGTGEGIPVVLLAGGAARHPSYLGDLAGLGEEHRLIVPHLRGVGLTEAPSDPQRGSWWSQAVDVEQLRIHLGLNRLALIAHSAGTRLAIAYAAQFPRNIAALVLITPPAGYLVDEPTDVPTLIDRRRGDPDFDRAILALRAGPATSTEDDFTAWQRDSAAAGYATWHETGRAHAQIGRWSRAAATAYFSVDPPHDIAAWLLEMTAPVLVIAGAQDCLVGFEPVQALARMFPAGHSVTIEECGHYPWVEQPAAFRRVLHTFLERLDQLTSDA
ncbi:alpha/beta fold hydrolase [Cryobacterium sp. N21]|uniref:alpha/beta fold hydrolase n=1 Tax=Cryobacterium sp. N21 TaxID=2048289 RepID=UPI000CE38447|nr:alpha/beta hydrolase [Cryobacterium sp. N21]